MIKYLIKSTNEFRVETMDDVEIFHKELQKKAADEGYTLSNFSWKECYLKEKGEIVDTYYQCKYTFTFNELKDPAEPWNNVNYSEVEM